MSFGALITGITQGYNKAKEEDYQRRVEMERGIANLYSNWASTLFNSGTAEGRQVGMGLMGAISQADGSPESTMKNVNKFFKDNPDLYGMLTGSPQAEQQTKAQPQQPQGGIPNLAQGEQKAPAQPQWVDESGTSQAAPGVGQVPLPKPETMAPYGPLEDQLRYQEDIVKQMEASEPQVRVDRVTGDSNKQDEKRHAEWLKRYNDELATLRASRASLTVAKQKDVEDQKDVDFRTKQAEKILPSIGETKDTALGKTLMLWAATGQNFSTFMRGLNNGTIQWSVYNNEYMQAFSRDPLSGEWIPQFLDEAKTVPLLKPTNSGSWRLNEITGRYQFMPSKTGQIPGGGASSLSGGGEGKKAPTNGAKKEAGVTPLPKPGAAPTSATPAAGQGAAAQTKAIPSVTGQVLETNGVEKFQLSSNYDPKEIFDTIEKHSPARTEEERVIRDNAFQVAVGNNPTMPLAVKNSVYRFLKANNIAAWKTPAEFQEFSAITKTQALVRSLYQGSLGVINTSFADPADMYGQMRTLGGYIGSISSLLSKETFREAGMLTNDDIKRAAGLLPDRNAFLNVAYGPKAFPETTLVNLLVLQRLLAERKAQAIQAKLGNFNPEKYLGQVPSYNEMVNQVRQDIASFKNNAGQSVKRAVNKQTGEVLELRNGQWISVGKQ